MKYFLFLVSICIVFTSCKKEIVNEEGKATLSTFNGLMTISANACIPTTDGNFIACGSDGANLYVTKYSYDAVVVWQTIIPAANYAATSIAEDDAHNVYVCGSLNDVNFDIGVYKFAANGNYMAQHRHGNTDEEESRCIIKTTDGNLLIAGTKMLSFSSLKYVYLLKTTTDGVVLWEQTYVGNDNQIPAHVLETPQGEYLITGRGSAENSAVQYLFYMNIGAGGSYNWTQEHPGANSVSARYTVQLADGNYITTGNSVTPAGDGQLWLCKANSAGAIEWQQTYGTALNFENPLCLVQAGDSAFFMCGLVMNTQTQQIDGIVFKASATGENKGFQYLQSKNELKACRIVKQGNEFVITGTQLLSQGVFQIFTTRIDANGNFIQ